MPDIRTIFVEKKVFFILIILGLFVINAIWVIPTLRNTRASASVFALAVAERIQSEINGSLGNALNQIIGVSGEIADEPERAGLIFQNLLRHHSIFISISLVNRSGRESVRVDRSGPLPPERFIDQSRNTEFYLALQGRTTLMQPIILPNGEVYTTLVVPVPRKGDFIEEVIIAELNVQNLLSIIRSPHIGEGYVYVLDRDGIEILHPDPTRIVKHQNLSARPIVKKVLIDGAIANGLASDDGYINDAGEDTFTVGMPIQVVKWGVFVEQPRSQALAGERQILILAAVTSLLAIIIFLAVALSISKLQELTTQFEKANENLYKQGAEISGKNKTLSLLNRLYEISVLSLEPKEIAARVTKTIQTDLAFELVGLFLYDRGKEALVPVAFASSERLSKIQSDAGVFFESITIPLSSSGFLKKIIEGGNMDYTEKPSEIWDNLVPEDMVTEMGGEGHVKSSFVHVLTSREKPVGMLIFSLNRPHDQLLEYETESIESFVNVVAVAIDKALLNEELRMANEHQVTLIHFITHQIKGFLTKSLYIFGELAEGTYGELAPKVEAIVKQGLQFNTDGVSMIQNVLHAANIKTGKVTYEKKPLDFKAVVETQVGKQKKSAEDRGLALALDIQPGDYTMQGDVEQLAPVVLNLVDNAIKYTPKGTVAVSLSKNASVILLSVKDSGIGVSDKDKPHLFTEGGRGEESQKVNVDSTGYGLFIVKEIVEAHGGKIRYESAGRGKGTTFFVELPGY